MQAKVLWILHLGFLINPWIFNLRCEGRDKWDAKYDWDLEKGLKMAER